MIRLLQIFFRIRGNREKGAFGDLFAVLRLYAQELFGGKEDLFVPYDDAVGFVTVGNGIGLDRLGLDVLVGGIP